MVDSEALALLRSNPLLREARPAHLEALARKCAVRHYDKGQRLARTGDAVTHLFALSSGAIEITRRNREAGTELLVGVLESPAIFGDAELYGRRAKWPNTVRAADAVLAVAIPHAAFDAFVSVDGAAAAALYRDASARHMLSVEITQVTGLQKLQHKILRLLWHAARGAPTGPERVVELSQVRLARALGVNPRTISRHLHALEDAGVLEHQGRQVILKLTECATFGPLLKGAGANNSWRLV